MMEGMRPAKHLRVNKSIRAAGAEAGDVSVMINQALRVYVVEGAFDEVSCLATNTVLQLLWLASESAADVMKQAH